jgi:hypothetical protein
MSTILTLDLNDDEAAALARLLRRTIDDDRYPMSPRLAPLRAILAKLNRRNRRPDQHRRCKRVMPRPQQADDGAGEFAARRELLHELTGHRPPPRVKRVLPWHRCWDFGRWHATGQRSTATASIMSAWSL